MDQPSRSGPGRTLDCNADRPATKGEETRLDQTAQGSSELALPAELDLAIGFRLRRAVTVADALFTARFGSRGITAVHYAILMSVRRNPGCQPSALGQLLGITPNNLVPLIDALSGRGLLDRTAGTRDRRARHLWLTSEGERFTAELAEGHQALQAQIEEAMGVQDAAELMRLLALYVRSSPG
ncbi:MarR family winged helix-turn-helix transcriptional regulator [Novosphingobium pentaromativorans]|uniref:HTH marR-type domain-containing protein n=1 Tax=Novosphingobium pentaromativorans US6-1 TaxID=1088721 RepID=G6EB79_9SPHN|nr:MarR family winged helix-turn-helix transcriptional regulator [Novosphingobium pentaromativorans]AIT80472.1 MarR family transcriptional regulator [Novosphingobium pentaromativorans US6-1]EHJ61438.1 hypothetical protein NSU_1600 [Novosphingobium pentaromativorans US6-1]